MGDLGSENAEKEMQIPYMFCLSLLAPKVTLSVISTHEVNKEKKKHRDLFLSGFYSPNIEVYGHNFIRLLCKTILNCMAIAKFRQLCV